MIARLPAPRGPGATGVIAMMDAFYIALAFPNVIFTTLLVMLAVYWVVVIVGGLGLDALDVDMDFDGDVGLDIDADLDADMDFDGHGATHGAGLAMLRFFNVGEVPLMILLSVLVLVMWVVGMLLHPYIGGYSLILQLLLLIPILLGAMFVTKILTAPLKKLFEELREQERATQNMSVVGMRCIVASLNVDHRMGQVTLATDGAPILLNVRTVSPDMVLQKGDEAVIVKKDDAQNLYIIRPFKLEV